MNFKKFISGVSALAIAASAFAAMTVTASAASYDKKYELDLSSFTSSDARVTPIIGLNRTVNATMAAQCNINDFGDTNNLTGDTYADLYTQGAYQHTALDGWGYIHSSYTALEGENRCEGRQHKLYASNSKLKLAGNYNSKSVGRASGSAVLTFTPANLDNYSTLGIGTTDTVYYKFTAQTYNGTRPIGFNTGSGAALTDAGNYSMAVGASHEVIMTYNQGTGEYAILIDGVSQKTGTNADIKGIYTSTANDSKGTSIDISDFEFGVYNAADMCSVTFTGAPAGTVITISGEDVTNGTSLESDASYAYIATCDGYDTLYGTFDIDNGETTKAVPVSMSAISASPSAMTNGADKSKSLTLLADGYYNTTQNVSLAGFDNALAIGDQVVIEYDMYVASGNYGKLYFTNIAGTVGANITLTAAQNTTTASYDRVSNGAPLTINTYTTGQWAHVRYVFNYTSRGSNARTESLSAIITPRTSGSANVADTTANAGYGNIPNDRNLSASTTGNVVFETIQFSGSFKIANAVAYVLEKEDKGFTVSTGINDLAGQQLNVTINGVTKSIAVDNLVKTTVTDGAVIWGLILKNIPTDATVSAEIVEVVE